MELQEFQTAFGAKLTQARKAAGLSKYRLSKISNIGRSHITGFEAGKENACLDSVRRLSNACKVQAKFFFDWA